MNRIGTVLRVAQGMLIASDPEGGVPAVGTQVIDEALEPVGEVVDVIGPVAKPYVVIDPTIEDKSSMLNRRVYAR